MGLHAGRLEIFVGCAPCLGRCGDCRGGWVSVDRVAEVVAKCCRLFGVALLVGRTAGLLAAFFEQHLV